MKPAYPSDQRRDGVRPRRRARTAWLTAASMVALLPAVMTSSASAAELVVHPGESIQAAVDAAGPGDTITIAPGTYHESVIIATDEVAVVGAGPDLTRIRPPAEANNPCAAEGFGVCIFGQFDENGDVVPVNGVRLSNLSVSGFGSADGSDGPMGGGVFVLAAHDTMVDHVVASDNGAFGFTSILTSGDRYLHDTAHDNGFAGFQIAETAGPGHSLRHVVADGSRFGIFVHDATGGLVARADLHHNCVGALFFGQGTSGWEMTHTTAHDNNRVCDAAPSGDPAMSGGGVAVIGADHVTIRHSTVTGNVPSADSEFVGGIIVGATHHGDQPSNVTVSRNVAEANEPADINWDGSGTGITFTRNDCDTSTPAGLCG